MRSLGRMRQIHGWSGWTQFWITPNQARVHVVIAVLWTLSQLVLAYFDFSSVPCPRAVAMVFHVDNWTHSFLLRKLECFKHVLWWFPVRWYVLRTTEWRFCLAPFCPSFVLVLCRFCGCSSRLMRPHSSRFTQNSHKIHCAIFNIERSDLEIQQPSLTSLRCPVERNKQWTTSEGG